MLSTSNLSVDDTHDSIDSSKMKLFRKQANNKVVIKKKHNFQNLEDVSENSYHDRFRSGKRTFQMASNILK
jgi:hypothetical protein